MVQSSAPKSKNDVSYPETSQNGKWFLRRALQDDDSRIIVSLGAHATKSGVKDQGVLAPERRPTSAPL